MNHKKLQILVALDEHGPMFGNQIAEATGQFRPFVYSRVFELVDEGLVTTSATLIPGTSVSRTQFKINPNGKRIVREQPVVKLFRRYAPA